MKQLRLLSVTFDQPIAPREIGAFRGAVIEKVGLQHDHYHNHNNEPGATSKFHYRYPLVQYKLRRQRPSLLFLDQGVEEAQHFFTRSYWNLTYAGKDYRASIADLRARTYEVGVIDEERHYRLRRWLPLNQDNYRRFQQLDGLVEQVAFLERILAGHLLGFAEGIGHRFERRFDLKIVELLGHRLVHLKGVQVASFDLHFKANVLLPPMVGIGKGVSQGYGVLGWWKNSEPHSERTN